jgi:DNA-binding transcriptional LysR family regulator
MERHQHARRRLKLRQLEILLAVADTGSMAKAATRLAITQPAISRALADAEHALGVPLFERGAHGVEPTQYGKALLKHGIAAFDELDQGIKEIDFLADPTAGELRIGTPAGLSEGIVLDAINRLSRQYPRVVFHVVIATGNALIDQLRERKVELGFDRQAVGQEDLNLELLYDEPLVVVAGAHNQWVRRRKIGLADLMNEPWTWPPPGSSYDALIIEAFRANGLTAPCATLYSHAINLRISLAATGPFLAVVNAGVMTKSGKYPAIRKLALELPTTRRELHLITLKKRILSPFAQRFVECVRRAPADEGGIGYHD